MATITETLASAGSLARARRADVSGEQARTSTWSAPGNRVTVTIRGHLDDSSAEEVSDCLSKAINLADGPVIIRLAKSATVDVIGACVLAVAATRAARAGYPLFVRGPAAVLYDIMSASGTGHLRFRWPLDSVLIWPKPDEATVRLHIAGIPRGPWDKTGRHARI